LSVGAHGAEMAEPANGLESLLPGELAEVAPLRERSGLESFTKTELPFDDPGFQRNRPYITRLKNPRGEIVLEEATASAGRPLVVHAPLGLGQVTFVAIDLDHESLKKWKGRPRLLAALMQIGGNEHEQTERESPRGVAQLGYDDLIGQLRTALDQFPGVSLVNFTTVSLLTLAYLALIGPADYFVLSRFSLPRHLTWLTFPLIAAAVIAVAAAMGGQAHGRRVRLNQAEIVDIDLQQQIARGTVWCHLYSPTTRRFDARLSATGLPPGILPEEPRSWLTWQGLPGDAMGGLESRQPSLLSREAYEVAAPGGQGEIDGLTVPIASSKSLSAVWWAKTNLPADSKLSIDRYGMLAGEFTLPLDVSLTECLLAHGEKLYRVGPLASGDRVKMADLPPLNLEARLTQRRIEQSKDVSTPWERDSVDVPRIMQMLMFHESARGRSYTGLTHRYQPQIDLSEHIRLGQAILVGRAKQPAAHIAPLTDPADTNSWTWYRVILPVSTARPVASDQ